ncbi:hypothetical protein HDU91_002424 [Kappamyces sp. JEL0680]|nr:hypothetical protein HDU91_002424 [Kappamyces sp. JEL0680]
MSQTRHAFLSLPDLACKGNGGKVLFATDDFFAVAENAIEDHDPVWDPNSYTPEGKEMDVESAIGKRSSVRGSKASEQLLKDVEQIESHKWQTILPFTKLGPGVPESRHHYVASTDQSSRFTHLRVNVFPDGGLARLRVYGRVLPSWDSITTGDFASLAYGNPNRPAIFKMGSDGMIEMVGKEWAVIQLGHACKVESLIIDTNHYKGNYPESCLVEYAGAQSGIPQESDWSVLLARTKLGPHQEHVFSSSQLAVGDHSVGFLRVTQYPDGGISRLRLFGSKA